MCWQLIGHDLLHVQSYLELQELIEEEGIG